MRNTKTDSNIVGIDSNIVGGSVNVGTNLATPHWESH